jgi:Ca2+/Na+ antiporter
MILVIVIFIDVPISATFASQTNQLLIALLIIFMIIVVDEIIGFLLGIILLIIYFKYYQKIIDNKNSSSKSNSNSNNDLTEPLIKAYTPFSMDNYNLLNGIDRFSGDIKPSSNGKINENIKDHYVKEDKENNIVEMPYISNELLLDAQNNIYDDKNYYMEIKKLDNAYGIQGLNSDSVHYMAYDKTTIDNNYK